MTKRGTDMTATTPETNLNEPTPVTTVSTQPTEYADIEKRLEESYRTDYLTLPTPPPPINQDRAAASDIERKAILKGYDLKDEDVVDASGTTAGERRLQLSVGMMPDDAPEEAMAGIGKHSIEFGADTVIVNPPNEIDRPVVISEPEVQTEGQAPAGSELMHSTTPVPDTAQPTEAQMEEAARLANSGEATSPSPTTAATPGEADNPANSPSYVSVDERNE